MGRWPAQLDTPQLNARAALAGRLQPFLADDRNRALLKALRALMKIYATYNIKGGVGTTSTAVNLAHLAAQSGYKRIAVGTSTPQGAATYMFRIRPKVKGGGRGLWSTARGPRRCDQGDPISTDLICCHPISATAIWMCSSTT